MLGLVTGFVVPDLSHPGVVCHRGKEDDRGLVVHSPRREALTVERSLSWALRLSVSCRMPYSRQWSFAVLGVIRRYSVRLKLALASSVVVSSGSHHS